MATQGPNVNAAGNGDRESVGLLVERGSDVHATFRDKNVRDTAAEAVHDALAANLDERMAAL